ncbi:hypothetical protein L873DRAFT_1815002, partial [Choiromyces venosus 120613-1]
TARAIDTLLGAVCPSKETESDERERREIEGKAERGQREVSLQILGSANLRGGREVGNEPYQVIERGGKERNSGRESSESGENIGREVEGKMKELRKEEEK